MIACESGDSAAPNAPCSSRNRIICSSGLRQSAHRRCQRESDKTHEEDLAPAEPRGEPADRSGHDGRCDDIGRQHPGDLVARSLQTALHVRQRDVGDGGVQHLRMNMPSITQTTAMRSARGVSRNAGRLEALSETNGDMRQVLGILGIRYAYTPLFSTDGCSAKHVVSVRFGTNGAILTNSAAEFPECGRRCSHSCCAPARPAHIAYSRAILVL